MSGTGLSRFYASHVSDEASDFRFVAFREFLMAHLRGRTVADIGCGTGMLARELARAGLDVLAVEPDDALYALAAEVRSASERPYLLRHCTADALGAGELRPYENILMIDVLEHVQDDRKLLRFVVSRMETGSQLLCLLPAIEPLFGLRDRRYGHFRRYSEPAARALFQGAGFADLELVHWNFIGAPVYWFCEKMLRRPVPEAFRQGRRGILGRFLNRALLAWFRAVENRGRAPWGLSILVKAVK